MSIDELYKILLSSNASDILRNRKEELFSLIPELEKSYGFEQNNDWHIYDVFEHILHVIDNVDLNITIRLAALFHDIGKPYTYTVDDNNIGHFYNHWVVSKEIFDRFSNKYNIDKNISDRVSNLIYYHDINISKLNSEELNSLILLFKSDGIDELYQLKRADLLAQNSKYHYILDEYDKQKKYLIKE